MQTTKSGAKFDFSILWGGESIMTNLLQLFRKVAKDFFLFLIFFITVFSLTCTVIKKGDIYGMGIHDAVLEDNLSKVEEIIKTDPNQINAKELYAGLYPLHYAVSVNNKEMVNLLIDKGASINAQSNDGSTSLHVASVLGYKEIVELLINRGADVNAKDNRDRTPLHLASQGGHIEIVKLLIGKGADIKLEDKDDWTPLDYAKVYNHKKIVDFLTSCVQETNVPRTLDYRPGIFKFGPTVFYTMTREDQPISIKIFYGTDRKRTGKEDVNDYYGSERGIFEYGTCIVTIPKKKHVKGELERPWRFWKENAEEHIVLSSNGINSMLGDEFFYTLSGKIKESTGNDAFVFVHGFDNAFADAARRTAQLAYDLGFEGAPIMYSWPSIRSDIISGIGYIADEDSVRETIANLKNFLERIISRTGVKKLHLIAHSMGNVALTDALKELKQNFPKEEPLFNQIILAAPDISAVDFEQNIAPAIKGSAKRITLYVSLNDLALEISNSIRGGAHPRAGQSGDSIVVLDGIDTIDASDVPTDLFGHGYFANTKPLIDDMHYMMFEELPPSASERKLHDRKKNGITYWFFPKTK